ncbi:MAG: DNA polymerase III subunit delta [Acidobacteria bacterium]|nr:DNA polymerase III subunit delta [Acidobacteriota bacterium]
MPVLTPAALRAQIAADTTASLYLLVGGDEVEKSAVAGEFADSVDEGLRAFNVDRVYGGEATADDLIQAAATLPMMAPRRIVIVHEAEKLLIPKRESQAADEELERLERFIQDPPPHATVVFVSGALDERRRVVKLLKKEAQVVDCGTVGDAGDAERWVKVRAAQLGVPLDAGAVRALVQRAGLDIAGLRGGLERVALYAAGQPAITAADVRQAVPAAPDAPTNWGIANAIDRHDAAEALHELHAALDAGDVPFRVLGQLRIAAEKMPPPRLGTVMEAMLEADLALKSSRGDPRVLLERLVVEMCSPRRR